MESEIDIISLIQSRRYMNAALRLLLPQNKIDELKNQTKYVEIDPDATESSSVQIEQQLKIEDSEIISDRPIHPASPTMQSLEMSKQNFRYG